MSQVLTDAEIIAGLGGPAGVARMCGIKPPSVVGWSETGIPVGRLIELAARIEGKFPGRFSRRERWPSTYMDIWPELADGAPLDAGAQVAQGRATEVGAVAS